MTLRKAAIGLGAAAIAFAAAAPAVAGEDYPLYAAPASGGRAPQSSQVLPGAQARLGNNPSNQGRNVADQNRVGSPVRGAPVAPSINGRGMGGGRMHGSMRGRR